MRIFFVAVGLLAAMFICLGVLFSKFTDQDQELKQCKQENDYYFERLSEANYKIMLADSTTKANGIFNPEVTTWQKQK